MNSGVTAPCRDRLYLYIRGTFVTIEIPFQNQVIAMTDRNTLPARRAAETFELQHGKQRTPFAVTFGYYEDRRLGEIFISGAKAGSEVEGVARDGAVLLSLALQYGVPIETIKGAITRNLDGSPSTIIGAVVDRIEPQHE
jgi:hypothetical protein